jgi:hypothetical protein
VSLKSKFDLTPSRLSFTYGGGDGDDDDYDDNDCDVDDYIYNVSKIVRVMFGCYDTIILFVLTSI